MTGSTVRSVMTLHHTSNTTDLMSESSVVEAIDPTTIVTTLTFTMGIVMVREFSNRFYVSLV